MAHRAQQNNNGPPLYDYATDLRSCNMRYIKYYVIQKRRRGLVLNVIAENVIKYLFIRHPRA